MNLKRGQEKMEIYDITIIGGGPVGMFAAFYCGLHQLKAQLIEALPELGGQPQALYPEKQIWDVAGLPGVTGRELTEHLQAQLQVAPVEVVTGQTVTNVRKVAEQLFEITTAHGVTQTKQVLITLGNGSFQPRPLKIPGIETLSDEQLTYFVGEKASYQNQRVAVLGGGNSAIDLALMLNPVAKSVDLIHRRETFRALPHSVALLNESTVRQQTPYLPASVVVNDHNEVELTLKKMRSDETKSLTVDRVLVNYGFTSNNQLGDWDVALNLDHQKLVVDQQGQTSQAGIYAAGDCVTYPSRAHLMATGFGEAVTAINAMTKTIYPDRSLAMHSSSMKIRS
ncbi:Thioredoxin reductase [Limosilactobacillus equigenerosi DSM 18793 = JCM 14505]|uniref:Ferredoxin--NADP reductase n=2 Tax=Limosilactobacillus TaxID=2742598 RepID=A0A0R1UPH0_9LACO|nr:Thioredoxin reductase [Limosilactobacillus equigenerosi DSM 18793 = JCM 14505]